MDAEIKRLAAKLDGFSGPGVVNHPRSLSIGPVQRGASTKQPQSKDGGTWMKITAATIDGTNRRWAYTVAEVRWTSGYTWAAVTNGKTGQAYNTIEVPNGATGSFGNGTSSTNFTGTFNVMPIGTNAIVRAWYVGTSSAVDYFAFTAINQVDGACP